MNLNELGANFFSDGHNKKPVVGPGAKYGSALLQNGEVDELDTNQLIPTCIHQKWNDN
jgi:hypothetical protein